jgi:hypothetical protein
MKISGENADNNIFIESEGGYMIRLSAIETVLKHDYSWYVITRSNEFRISDESAKFIIGVIKSTYEIRSVPDNYKKLEEK